MTFSIDNYSLGLCDDHYIIGHFNNLSPEDQRTVLTFLDNMESLKKALPSDDSASDELNLSPMQTTLSTLWLITF